MPSYPQTERLHGDVLGIIDPRLLYDTRAVMSACGIGRTGYAKSAWPADSLA